MRIIQEPEFLTMPAGTLYAKYTPCSFGEIAIKDETVSATWWYQSLLPWFEGANDTGAWIDMLDAMVAGTAAAPLDFDCTEKDGLYEHDQLFAVLDRADVEALIARLQRALLEGYSV
jgi:hypothetical protein